MRVILDGKKGRAVGFNLHDYRAVEYGYAATVHKTQGARRIRVRRHRAQNAGGHRGSRLRAGDAGDGPPSGLRRAMLPDLTDT